MFGWFREKGVDPVCLMRVNPKKAAASSMYNGKSYCFCDKICKEAFDTEPEQFLENNLIVYPRRGEATLPDVKREM